MLPLTDRTKPWDSNAAEKRIRSWAGGPDNINWSKYGKAFFYVDSENKDKIGGYKLPFADIIDGKLVAVPRAIFAVAAALQGARGGVNIPENEKSAIRSKVQSYYSKMKTQFNDDSLKAPWEVKKLIKMSAADEDKRLVYGIVLEPNVVDLQNDMINELEIEKACHEFMEKYQNVGIRHKGVTKQCKIVENYIAPQNMSIGNGQDVTKGSWVMVIKVYDDNIWSQIKSSNLTGLSIGGYGAREVSE